jgi:hypothetical protein
MENNPYETPKSEVDTPVFGKRSIFWKIYFVIITLLTVAGYSMMFALPGFGWAEIFSMVVSVIFTVGFFGYVFNKKIISNNFWLITLIISIIWSVLYYFVSGVDLSMGLDQQSLIIEQLIGWIISLPAYIGLFLYSRPKHPVWLAGQ